MNTPADFDGTTTTAPVIDEAHGRRPAGMAGALGPARWPTMLALVVVAAVSVGGGNAHLVAVVVMVVSLSHLAAAALGFRGSDWLVAGAATAAVAIAMFTPVDAIVLLLVAAVAFVGLGFLRGTRVDRRALGIRTAAFVGFTAFALTAMMLDPVAGVILAALTSLARAVWDLFANRRGEVVGRTFAEFSAVLCAGAGFALLAGWAFVS